jgi:hypothetical protein
MSALLYALGGAIFMLLGLLHGVYTLADIRHPRRLVRADTGMMAAMRSTGVRLARGSTITMWQAWVGFNLSHSLGAIIFGAAAATWSLWPAIATTPWLAALPAGVGLLYGAIGWRCWFWIPNTGIAIATLCLAGAALLTP